MCRKARCFAFTHSKPPYSKMNVSVPVLIPLLYNARKKKVVEFFVKADIYFCFFFVSVKRRRFTITAGALNIKKLPLRETVRMHTVPVKGAKFLLCGFKAEACGKSLLCELFSDDLCNMLCGKAEFLQQIHSRPEWPYTSLTPMRVTGVGKARKVRWRPLRRDRR